jgi:type IV pilus assembly protein PilC
LARYAYTATGPDGRPATGVEKAPSREAAELTLYGRGYRYLTLTEKPSPWRVEIAAPRVRRDDVMHLSRQLGAFIRAGLPLIDAVRTIGEEATNSSVRRMISDVEAGLRRGERLSECVDRHPKIFPEYYRGILRSAELTGQLDTVLDQLARYLERDLEARRKVTAAMIYPSVIVAMAVATVAVLAGFVLPRFKVFFASLHARLPLPTRMLLAVTDFLTAWWWAVLGGLALVILTGFLVVRTEPGRYARDRLLLALPVIGDTVRYTLVERFCRVLAAMVSAGVGLPEALRVSTGALRNLVFTRSLAVAGEAMLRGDGLARPLAGTALFPPTAARMIRVGEETGTLDVQLEVTARYYESELEYKLKRLTAIIEPTVIIAVGLLVGFVAVALVSAMYGIFGQVGA